MRIVSSIILAAAMLMALAMPAFATDTGVEVTTPTLDVQITSDIVIDEKICDLDEFYPWYKYGKLDAIVAGKELKGIMVDELAKVIREEYDNDDYFFTRTDDQIPKERWAIGIHKCTLSLKYTDRETREEVTVLTFDVNVNVQETKIKDITGGVITIKEGTNGAGEYADAAMITYNDGTTEKAPMTFYGIFSLEVGTYTSTGFAFGCIEVPVTINVVPYDTSGKCGDNMTWVYDAEAKRLTISGTGDMYKIAKNVQNFYWDILLYRPDFWHWKAEEIVVEEGVEHLSDFAFCDMHPKAIKLPTTLREIPQRLLTRSQELRTLVIPEGITSLTGYPFEYTNVEELYLPSTLKEMDVLTVYYLGVANDTLKKIHFAGTEEEWNAIKRIKSEAAAENPSADKDYARFDEKIKNVEIIFDPKTDISVENGVAAIPDEDVEIKESEDTVIDVTGTAEKAEGVSIESETVDRLAENNTAVEIKLPDASVSFDKTAIDSISEQAGESPVTIVAKKAAESVLNEKQQAALEKTNVCSVLTLESIAGETKITDFGGGKVTVSIPFDLPEGKDGKDFYAAYVAEDGTVTSMPTTYADGKLTFETTHFSDYVVVDKSADDTKPDVSKPEDTSSDASQTDDTSSDVPQTDETSSDVPQTDETSPDVPQTDETSSDAPQTGDSNYILILAVLMIAGAAGLALCKKLRVF